MHPEVMKVARAKGHLRGKQPKLTVDRRLTWVSLLASGEYSAAEVAELVTRECPWLLI